MATKSIVAGKLQSNGNHEILDAQTLLTEITEIEDLLTGLELSEKDKELSDLDKKVIQYLDLLDDYIRLSEAYSDNFKNGFINLSRANYASNRRFNMDFYDHREMRPAINVSFEKGKHVLIDNLAIQKLVQQRQKESEKYNEKPEDKEEGTLRNRKQKSNPPTSEILKVTERNFYKNPINMFGAFVPYQLKESQNCFSTALENSIKILNVRNELQVIYKEIKLAKKERAHIQS